MMNSVARAAAEVDASFIAGCKLSVGLLHGNLKCRVLIHKCFKKIMYIMNGKLNLFEPLSICYNKYNYECKVGCFINSWCDVL